MRVPDAVAGDRVARAIVLAVTLGLLAGGVVATAVSARPSDPTGSFRFGVTHAQQSADSWGSRGAVTRARAVLAASTGLQAQAIMGWGVDSPEPSPGTYKWGSLDARMRLIRSTGGTPVITLCCAPDWMKGGEASHTDWNKIEQAPLPQHFGDFAALAAKVATRYRDVRYFQVWNELKGFWSDSANRWEYEQYTKLYNDVYDAVQRVRPDAQLGGPYVVLDTLPPSDATNAAGASGTAQPADPSQLSGKWGTVDPRDLDVLSYWLNHAHGAQFVVVDATTATRDNQLTTDPYRATEKFAAIDRWLRQRTALPIWYAEWSAPAARGGDITAVRQRTATTQALALAVLADTGASAALLWGPECDDKHDATCLWTSTRTPGGGHPTPFATVAEWFAKQYRPGTKLLGGQPPGPGVWQWPGRTADLVVNATARRVQLDVHGTALTLDPYAVRTVPRLENQ